MNLIVQEGKYYLYRHIRLDKNEVFYIGIGTKKKNGGHEYLYRRAYYIDSRNNYWNNVVNKTSYEVEIVLESDDLSFIKQKEIEFITLYGRKDLGLGTLVNMTNGGEGNHGLIFSEERRKQMSIISKGRKHTLEARRKMSIGQKNRPSRSEETRKKVAESNRGKKRSDSLKELLSVKAIERHKVGIYKGTAAKGSKASQAKLTEEQVLEIKDMLNNHVPYKEISKMFGIKENTITSIQKGDSWSYLTGFTRETSCDKRKGYSERSKLKPEDVLQIKELIDEGKLQQKEIAAMFGVARNTITGIYKGSMWGDLTGYTKETSVDRRVIQCKTRVNNLKLNNT